MHGDGYGRGIGVPEVLEKMIYRQFCAIVIFPRIMGLKPFIECICLGCLIILAKTSLLIPTHKNVAFQRRH
jgi:hypothetical protein